MGSVLLSLVCVTLVSGGAQADRDRLPFGAGTGREHERSDHEPRDDMVRYSYTMGVVKEEHIVIFHKYLNASRRLQYISEALQPAGALQWELVKRENPASGYPSDFSVLKLPSTSQTLALNVSRQLLGHPHIRSVSPQRRVVRTISGLNPSEEGPKEKSPPINLARGATPSVTGKRSTRWDVHDSPKDHLRKLHAADSGTSFGE